MEVIIIMDKGSYIESKYINAYCQSKKYKHYIIRVDHYSNGWYMVSGFLSAADASRKKYTTIFDKYRRKSATTSLPQDDFMVEEEISFSGGIISDDYYSCPYCGNTSIVKCGKCGRVCCNPDNSKFFRCLCRNSGTISGTIQSLRTIDNGAEKMKKK